MRELLKHILIKMSSGRWILTIACSVVFGYCSINKIIPVDATVSIITMVFVSYFQRQDRGKENGGQQNGKTPPTA